MKVDDADQNPTDSLEESQSMYSDPVSHAQLILDKSLQ